MGIIGSILIRLGIETSEFDTKMGKAAQQSNQFGKSFKGMSNAGAGFRGISESASRMTQSLAGTNPIFEQINRGVSGVTGSIGQMGNGLGAVGGIATGALAVVGLAFAGIAAQIEHDKKLLDDLAKSATEFANILREIAKLRGLTPDKGSKAESLEAEQRKLQDRIAALRKTKPEDQAGSEVWAWLTANSDNYQMRLENLRNARDAEIRFLEGQSAALGELAKKDAKAFQDAQRATLLKPITDTVGSMQGDLSNYGLSSRQAEINKLRAYAESKGLGADSQAQRMIADAEAADKLLTSLEKYKEIEDKLTKSNAEADSQLQKLERDYRLLTGATEGQLNAEALRGEGVDVKRINAILEAEQRLLAAKKAKADADKASELAEKARVDAIQQAVSGYESLVSMAESLLSAEDQAQSKRDKIKEQIGSAAYEQNKSLIERLTAPKSGAKADTGSWVDAASRWREIQSQLLKPQDDTPKATLQEIRALVAEIKRLQREGMPLKA